MRISGCEVSPSDRELLRPRLLQTRFSLAELIDNITFMVREASCFEQAQEMTSPARLSIAQWLWLKLFKTRYSSEIPLVKLSSLETESPRSQLSQQRETDEEDGVPVTKQINPIDMGTINYDGCSEEETTSSSEEEENCPSSNRERWQRTKASSSGGGVYQSFEATRRGLRKGRRLKEAFDEDEDTNEEETEEERLLRSWLNSLDPNQINLPSFLHPSIRTGLPLLKAADIIKPSSVDWTKAYEAPFRPVVHRICCVCNSNLLIETLKKVWGLQLVNIGGIDLAEGNRKAVLSLVYQMMRFELALLLRARLGSNQPSSSLEQHVVNWANAKIVTRRGGGG